MPLSTDDSNRLARLEERMVMVVGSLNRIEKKIFETPWGILASCAGIAALVAMCVAVKLG